LFVDNVSDDRGVLNSYDTPFADFVVRTRPRTVGIRTSLEF